VAERGQSSFTCGTRRRWLILPVASVLYVVLFLRLYPYMGGIAFTLGILAPSVVVALAGLGPGLVMVLLVSGMNYFLAQQVKHDMADHATVAVFALIWTAIPLALTAGLRTLLQRMTLVNQKLDEQMVLHQNLLLSLGEGVAVFDREERFVFANGAAEHLFGAMPGTLVGRTLPEFLTPESKDRLADSDVRDGMAKLSFELRLATAESVTVLVTQTKMIHGSGGEIQTLRVLRDITARERLERERSELEQYLQRTEALQSLAVLAGGVAHDFNNLLGGVIGSTQLGLLRLKKSPSQAEVCLEEAQRFAVEASELSRKMLTYAGKRGIAPVSLDLGGEVVEAIRFVISTISAKAVLCNEIPAALPRISADRTGLHQVIANLVLNAAEAMPNGVRGRVTLRACERTVEHTSGKSARMATAPLPGQYVVLSVTDNGVGMTESTRARLFEPFFSTKFQGRGMGLAATWGIVKAHRGGLTVESQPGEGSTFSVYWPLASEAHVAASTDLDGSPISFVGTTLLLVDDDAKVRQVSRGLLEELGCNVLEAGGGQEALAWFERGQPPIDLVVLDLTMPERSGLEVLDDLRKQDPNVKVILTSGYSNEDVGEPLRRPSVVGFLPKPHHFAGLRSAIGRGLAAARDETTVTVNSRGTDSLA
jgi:two-component system, cell cycle sensor histidine kinase and response regulator CckA